MTNKYALTYQSVKAILAVMTNKTFHDRLRFVREMREMTQAQVGNAAEMDQTSVAHYEAGRRSPSLDNLRALSKALMVSADYLLGLSERIGP